MRVKLDSVIENDGFPEKLLNIGNGNIDENEQKIQKNLRKKFIKKFRKNKQIQIDYVKDDYQRQKMKT